MKEANYLENFEISQASGEPSLYHGCMLEKHHKQSYPINPEKVRSIVPGEFLHADVCGSIRDSSIGNARYFLLCKDDCIGYRYVHFLKQKSEVFEALQKVIMMMEHDIGNILKKFRSDKGGEFCTKIFDDFLIEKKIIRHTLEALG
jgi:hypothetical protein